MKFISHPEDTINGELRNEILLKDHLLEVAKNSADYIEELEIDNKPILEKCAFIAGMCHDFGKYTSFFQMHLKGKGKSPKSQHAFISSIFGAFLGYDLLELDDYRAPLLIYLAIKHHHGNLKNLKDGLPGRPFGKVDEITDDSAEKIDLMREQIEDLKSNRKQIISELEWVFQEGRNYGINSKVDFGSFFENKWQETINKLIASARRYRREYLESNDIKTYLYLMLIFSSLIDGDKRSAGRVTQMGRPSGIVSSLLTNYLNSVVKNTRGIQSLDSVRAELLSRVTSSIEKQDLSSRIYTITAPTGTGKTLSALTAAVKIRERIYARCETQFRIIYALPFTSIVDQTYSIIDKVLQPIEGYNSHRQRFLMEHHHLSDVFSLSSKNDNSENHPLDLYLALMESWDSEIIVTTFVQVFQSLIGNRNRAIKKFHRIANSIIILDEIQSLEVEKWKTIGEVIKQVSECLNIYFILMTATQPHIFDDRKPIELGFKEYPQMPDRTIIRPLLDRIDMDHFIDMIIDKSNEGKSVLVIRNTIKTSINTYDTLKSRSNDLKYSPQLFYLSTNITPSDRVSRVKKIAKALDCANKRNIILISTQVVEAGIDLDFDSVIRDIAPIDSIIQAAGRCNRNGKNVSGSEVLIVNQGDDPNSIEKYPTSSRTVYGKWAMETAVKSLSNFKGEIHEKNYPIIIKDYFERICVLNSCGEPVKKNELLNSMAKLDFDDNNGPANFSVIKSDRPLVDLCVVRNNEDALILDWYRNEILREPNPIDRKRKYLERKTEFRMRIISVDLSLAKKIGAQEIDVDDNLFYLSQELSHEFYDEETGLKRFEDAFRAY